MPWPLTRATRVALQALCRWPAARVHALVLATLLLWAGLECFGPLPSQAIAASTYDQMQQHRLWASAPDPRLLIIDIDERSLADMAPEFGRWPWPRDTLATVLDHAQAQGALAVVFDILFADPDRVHPGGDRALEAAVRAGQAGFFPVVRLPPALDARSALGADQVPGLASGPGPARAAAPSPAPAAASAGPAGSVAPAPRVALILPFMQAMLASGRLGTNTVRLDSDGKVRRFAATEALAGGWQLRALPTAVAQQVGVAANTSADQRLVVWRRQAHLYPRVPFAVAWQCAEGRARADCPSLAGRILVIGATAAALHDVKTSPLAVQHAGVDILATLIDNALHQRSVRELPQAWRWLITAAALGLAWAVLRRGGAGSTGLALWGLPFVLLAIGWASLHSEAVYIDLTLPATAVLGFFSAVALHDRLRRWLFSVQPDDATGPCALLYHGPAAQAEQLERSVFDLAARRRLAVSGLKAASGAWGAHHAVWVLWGLPDQAAAQALLQDLPNAPDGRSARCFDVGASAPHDLFHALAEAAPAAADATRPPTLESLHVQA